MSYASKEALMEYTQPKKNENSFIRLFGVFVFAVGVFSFTIPGGLDMSLLMTLGGAAMSPFGTFYQCYCDASDGSGNQMEYGFDTSKVMVTYNVDGTEMTASLQDWANWGNNADVASITPTLGAFADYSYATRCAFMAGVERGLLAYYTTVPLYYRNSASLLTQQCNYAADSYVQLVGFGGMDYMTYNYDDAEWADYIANNTLQY